MIVLPKSGITYIYEDNMLLIHNTSKLDSTLKKKFNVIASHAIHKSVAMKESSTLHMKSKDNLADLLSKLITEQKRKHLVSKVLHDIFDKNYNQQEQQANLLHQ